MPEEKTFEDYFNEAINDGEPTDTVKEIASDEQELEQTQDQKQEEQDQPDDASGFDDLDIEAVNRINDPADDKPDYEAKYNEAIEKISKLEQKMSSWEGRIRKANEKADEWEQKYNELKEAKSEKKPDPFIEKPEVSEDHDLEDFFKEFPSFKDPIMKVAEKIATKIVNDRIAEIDPKIQQLEAKRELSDKERHYQEIYNAHKDWQKIYQSDDFVQFIENQPNIIKKQYQAVIKQGTSNEIIELFDIYKQSKVKDTTVKIEDKDKQKRQKIQDALAVEGSTGGPPKKKEIDKQDFDSAWESALAS